MGIRGRKTPKPPGPSPAQVARKKGAIARFKRQLERQDLTPEKRKLIEQVIANTEANIHRRGRQPKSDSQSPITQSVQSDKVKYVIQMWETKKSSNGKIEKIKLPQELDDKPLLLENLRAGRVHGYKANWEYVRVKASN